MTSAANQRIEDTGRKLGGARKDVRARKRPGPYNPTPGNLPSLLAELWPKPDFRNAVLGGSASSRQAALFMVVYRTLPARPYGDAEMEDYNEGCLGDFTAAVQFLRGAYEAGEIEDLTTLREAFNIAEAAWSQSVGRSRAFFAAGRRSGRRRLRHALDVKISGELLAEFLPEWGWPYDERVQDDDAFGVWRLADQNGLRGKWVCVKGHGQQAEILTEGRFDTREEALAAATVCVEAALDKRANKSASVRAGTNVGRPRLTGAANRVGPARRSHSVSPQDFVSTFRFRGVEFGNWLSQAERQAALDMSYDALLDLTELCGLPPAFASLGGKLGVGFASRGRGFRSGAAHFEPSTWILHFTKRSGAGALAHEFGHAFDYYVGALLEPGMTLSKLLGLIDEDSHGFCEPGLRDAIATPARRLNDAMCGGLLQTQWTEFRINSDALDRGRSKRYWSSREEMFARCFEAWAMDALAGRGQLNDYLVYAAGEDAEGIWHLPHPPYPKGHERTSIVSAMGCLLAAAASYWKEKRRTP